MIPTGPSIALSDFLPLLRLGGTHSAGRRLRTIQSAGSKNR